MSVGFGPAIIYIRVTNDQTVGVFCIKGPVGTISIQKVFDDEVLGVVKVHKTWAVFSVFNELNCSPPLNAVAIERPLAVAG